MGRGPAPGNRYPTRMASCAPRSVQNRVMIRPLGSMGSSPMVVAVVAAPQDALPDRHPVAFDGGPGDPQLPEQAGGEQQFGDGAAGADRCGFPPAADVPPGGDERAEFGRRGQLTLPAFQVIDAGQQTGLG